MTKTTAQYRLLGEILVDDGVITQGQLDEALSKQAQTAGFLGQALVDMGYIDEQSLSSILAKHCRIPYLSLLNYLVDEELLVVVPKELCLKHKMLPIDRLSDNLTLAIVDPMNEAALAEVRAACPDLKIKPVVCDLRHFRIVAERLFGETGDRAAPVESTEPNVAQETPGGASPQEPAAATAPKRAADEEASAPAKPAAEGLGESADAEGNPAATRAAPGANVVSIIEGSMRDTYEMLSRKVPLFSGIEPAFVAAIFGSGMTKEIEAGTAVFAQGELSSELYVILAGEVQIRDGDRVIATLPSGEMFGEMALVSQGPRSASAATTQTTSLFVLDRATFDKLLTKKVAIDVLLNMLKISSQRVLIANEKLAAYESSAAVEP